MTQIIARPSLDLEHLSATICAELASGMADAAGIREKYEISDEEWEVLKTSSVFRAMLAEAVKEWTGDLNAGKRIMKKAEIMLEDSLPVLYEIAHDKASPRQQRIDSIKEMGILAGKKNQKGEAAGAPGGQRGAVINIAIVTRDGEQKLEINSTQPVLPALLDAEVVSEQ